MLRYGELVVVVPEKGRSPVAIAVDYVHAARFGSNRGVVVHDHPSTGARTRTEFPVLPDNAHVFRALTRQGH
jgi:hypothetical protein